MSRGTKIAAVIIILGILLLLGGGVAMAADPANPGDALFGVDIAAESLRRTLTTNPASKADFEIDILDERMEELEKLELAGENIDESIEEVADQQDRLYTQMREMEENGEGVTEGEKERIWTRYEERYEYHLEYMEQLQKKQGDQEQYGENGGNGAGDCLDEECDNGDTRSLPDMGLETQPETKPETLLDSVTGKFRNSRRDTSGQDSDSQQHDGNPANIPDESGENLSEPQSGAD